MHPDPLDPQGERPSKTMIATLIPTIISSPFPNVSNVTSPNTSGPKTTR